MAKKKHTQTSALPEGEANESQAQQILVQYHQIADNLRASKDQAQAETALAAVNNAPEGIQIALLKELAKENHVDAADILVALNTLSPLKSVRKEAKRSLIQLAGMKIHPHWEPPVEQSPAIGIAQPSTNPPRFWKCLVTDSHRSGKAQLLCSWEQGDDYKEVRVLGFLLDFRSQGVKDFLLKVESKRSFEKFVAEVAAEMPDVPMKECSLAKARSLLLEALEINKRLNVRLPADYRSHLSLTNQLILEAPDLAEENVEDEEREELSYLHGFSPEDIVYTFLQAWTDEEDYETAYDLLAQDSPLREGLPRDEWIDQRGLWAMRTAPYELELDFCYERPQPESQLQQPDSSMTESTATHKEVEVGWSITLDKELFSPDEAPPELPAASAVYAESGRHWFWSSYTLVQENDAWRIQSMTDESIKAQEIPAEELQKKIQEVEGFLEELRSKNTVEEIERRIQDKHTPDYYIEILRRITQTNYYADVLDKRMLLEPSAYEEVADRMFDLDQYERSLTYWIPLAQRFPEQRGRHLRRVAETLLRLSEEYYEEDGEDDDYDEEDESRADRCITLAEQALRESLQAENSFEGHIELAELLISLEERLEEAEDHLQQARELMSDPKDEAKLERDLGAIAKQRQQYKKALKHYQRVAELLPENSEAWADVAQAHQKLGNVEEAETNYKQAIALDPRAVYYFTLGNLLYKQNHQPAKALKILEEGLAANPDSAELYVYTATIYIDSRDYNQAEICLDKAEEIDPNLELIATYRPLVALGKLEQMEEEQTTHKPGRPLKRKGQGRK